MRRNPVPGLDLGVYLAALPVLARNPAIIVIPLLMAILVILLGQIGPGGGALGGLTALFATMLGLFGLGAACIMADDAWRHGRASFENGWTEARRRAGDIFMASIGVTLLLTVAGYIGALIGPLALLIVAAAVIALIWTIPAAAIGGVPGSAAIQISIDRVRTDLATSAVAGVVSALIFFLAAYAGLNAGLLIPPIGGSLVAVSLVQALFQSIGVGYMALVLAKLYADGAFGRRR